MRALALILLVPLASAAGFTLGADRTMEVTVDAEGLARFLMPVHIEANGSFYAKMLATPDNAATSGPGWNVTYLLNDAPLAEATPTPVVEGSDVVFEALVRAPDTLAQDARVYVALAYRPPAAGTSGDGSSGATQDEARALTLVVHPAEGTPTLAPTEITATPTPPPSGEAPNPTTSESNGRDEKATPLPLHVLALALALALVARYRR